MKKKPLTLAQQLAWVRVQMMIYSEPHKKAHRAQSLAMLRQREARLMRLIDGPQTFRLNR